VNESGAGWWPEKKPREHGNKYKALGKELQLAQL